MRKGLPMPKRSSSPSSSLGDTMGIRYMLVTDTVGNEWVEIILHKKTIINWGSILINVWVEPPIPKDFKVICKERDPLHQITKYKVSSSLYPKVPFGQEIPIISFTIHLGNKPTMPFIFR